MKTPQNVIPMTSRQDAITTAEQLLAAARNPTVQAIVIRGRLADVPPFRLSPGQSLKGENGSAALEFREGKDGLELSTDNEVSGILLQASPECRVIHNDTSVKSLGQIRLAGITATGQVQILARDGVRSGHVEVEGLDIVTADVTGRQDRPAGFGVEVLQGAFTLWNMHADRSVSISARLVGLAAGREGAPAYGSGIFVAGGGVEGGALTVSLLETGAVYTDGGIPVGAPSRITAGVFTLSGAHVDLVQNRGPIVTYGANDVVLDNWGDVDRWIAAEKVTSYGPSGIGFANYGTLNEVRIEAPIETFGTGARGFDVHAGTVHRAYFDRITTHADGAVGLQIGRPMRRLVVRRGVRTFGGTGPSLVKGVVTTLAAIGISVTAGGVIGDLEIDGGITTRGRDVPPLEVEGFIGTMRIGGGVAAGGDGFEGA